MSTLGIRNHPTGPTARSDLAKKFHLSKSRQHHLPYTLVEQLERCKSDEARLVLLGIRGDIFANRDKNLKTKKRTFRDEQPVSKFTAKTEGRR